MSAATAIGAASITVTLTSEHVLTVDECFPNGVPDDWSAETILAAIQKDGLAAWALDAYGFELRVEVTRPNPHYKQSEALIPDLAPSRFERSSATGSAS